MKGIYQSFIEDPNIGFNHNEILGFCSTKIYVQSSECHTQRFIQTHKNSENSN